MMCDHFQRMVIDNKYNDITAREESPFDSPNVVSSSAVEHLSDRQSLGYYWQ